MNHSADFFTRELNTLTYSVFDKKMGKKSLLTIYYDLIFFIIFALCILSK